MPRDRGRMLYFLASSFSAAAISLLGVVPSACARRCTTSIVGFRTPHSTPLMYVRSSPLSKANFSWLSPHRSRNCRTAAPNALRKGADFSETMPSKLTALSTMSLPTMSNGREGIHRLGRVDYEYLGLTTLAMPIPIIPDPSTATSVLLLHAPYPGKLKFNGMPSSLLHAIAPLAHRLLASGALGQLGILDPGTADNAYRSTLAHALASPNLRVLCISSSTAAGDELARAIDLARSLRGDELLIVVGGPHEDDCELKTAERLPGIDLSIAGDAEQVLDFVLHTYLMRDETPRDFVTTLAVDLPRQPLRGGRVIVSGPACGSITLNLPRLSPSDLAPPVWTTKRVSFSVFQDRETLPIMVTRGCPYGRCAFCAEPNRDAFLMHSEFAWVHELAAMRPNAAIYLQDSILPAGATVEQRLLPMLRELDRPWGCQVYLPTLTRAFLRKLASNGCNYIYTGLEAADSAILAAVGKHNLTENLALERLAWARDCGLHVGVSLMFGALGSSGELLETQATIAATVEMADRILAAEVPVAGFYPNIMTVLPGTALARGLASHGIHLDFYRMPRSQVFQDFEDGAVGYNFTTLPSRVGAQAHRDSIAEDILQAAAHIQRMGVHSW